MSYLGNPKMVMMAQDTIPIANFEYPSNPTASVNPVRIPVTWVNTSTGCMFICTDNTSGANVWKLQSGFRGALATSLVAQPILTSTWTTLDLEITEYDTDLFHSAVTNNSRLTIPDGVSIVSFAFGGTFDTNPTGYRLMMLGKNGSEGVIPGGGSTRYDKDPSNSSIFTSSTAPVYVSPGDYFEVFLRQTSGVTLNTAPFIHGTYLSLKVIE